jgi:hypothetical protein
VSKPRRWLLAGGAFLFLVIAAALVILPRLVDTPAARAEIQRRLDAALGGHITWQALEVRLLPAPHGELQQVRIEIPGKLGAEAERLQVYLRLWPLLRGRAEIASVTLDHPRIRVLPSEASQPDAPLDTMAAYRAVMQPTVLALQEFATETTLRLSGAEFAGPIALRGINATARGDATGLDLELEVGSELWKRLRATGRLQYADLSAKVSARLEDLDLPAVGALAGLEKIGSLEGRASANATLTVDDAWRVDIALARSSATFKLEVLPAPVSLSGGAARLDERGLRLDKVALSLLDAKATIAGTITLPQGRVELSLADGVAGEGIVRWGLEKAGAPAALDLRTPLRLAARRIAWDSKGGLALDASVTADNAPRVGITLGWKPQRLELRALSIKDAQSDATFTAVVGDDVLRVGFSGELHARSLAALRGQPEPRTGRLQGNLNLIVDRERPLLTMAEGRLAVSTLDLSVLVGKPAMIESAELAADRSDLRIEKARVVVDEQVLELSGKVSGTQRGPVVDARLESPGVIMERLLPPKKPDAQAEPSKLWPLPVTGKVAVRVGFIEFAQKRVEPVEGTLVLEPERARIDLQQAKMCGVSFPLQMDATPGGYNIATRLAMKNEPFESAIKCLTGDTVQITGGADLRAELRTQGRASADLLRNLTGTAEAELRKGRVDRFALIGNIMSVQNITALRDPRQIDKGFLYRSMTAKGRFEGGAFHLEEGFFDSDAARIAVNGKIDLLGDRTQLNVLVGLLSSVDRVTGAIPILGDVLGGTLIAVPVSVSGDIRDPRVVPLGPRAVSDRLLGIFERTLKLPGKLKPGETKEPAVKEPAATEPER